MSDKSFMYATVSHPDCLHRDAAWPQNARRGFTLVELMITVSILAILAAIVIPAFSNHSKQAQITSTIYTMQTFQKAIQRYNADTATYPPDVYIARTPSELVGYIPDNSLSKPVPIGGYWDYNNFDDEGVSIGIYVDVPNDDNRADWLEIDNQIDNNDLTPGSGMMETIGANGIRYFVEKF